MRRVVAAIFLTIAGLIPLWRFHPGASAPVGSAHATAGAGAATPAPVPRQSGSTKTIDGSTVDTEFGPYQVRVTFNGTTIAGITIVTTPRDRRSQRIASRAEPRLREEALRAQSADIDTVSGATITSEAYAQSLQAAIDANRG
ncbi:MAG: FMN-binding protein [Labedaea sp.]